MDRRHRRRDEEVDLSDGRSSEDGSFVSGDDNSYDSASSSSEGSYSASSASQEEESRTGSGESLGDNDREHQASRSSDMVYDNSFALSDNRSTAGHSFVDGGENSFLFESRDFGRGAAQQSLRIVANGSLMSDTAANVSLIEVTSLEGGSSTGSGQYDDDNDEYSEASQQQHSREGSFSGSYSDDDNYRREGSFSPLPASNTGESYSGSYSDFDDQPSRYQSSVDDANFSGSFDNYTLDTNDAFSAHAAEPSHSTGALPDERRVDHSRQHQTSASFSGSYDDQSPDPSNSYTGSSVLDEEEQQPGEPPNDHYQHSSVSFSGSYDDRSPDPSESSAGSSCLDEERSAVEEQHLEEAPNDHPHTSASFSGSYDDQSPDLSERFTGSSLPEEGASNVEIGARSLSGSLVDDQESREDLFPHHAQSLKAESFSSSSPDARELDDEPHVPDESFSGSYVDSNIVDGRSSSHAESYSASFPDDNEQAPVDEAYSSSASQGSFSGSYGDHQEAQSADPSSTADSFSGSDEPGIGDEPNQSFVSGATFPSAYSTSDPSDALRQDHSSNPSVSGSYDDEQLSEADPSSSNTASASGFFPVDDPDPRPVSASGESISGSVESDEYSNQSSDAGSFSQSFSGQGSPEESQASFDEDRSFASSSNEASGSESFPEHALETQTTRSDANDQEQINAASPNVSDQLSTSYLASASDKSHSSRNDEQEPSPKPSASLPTASDTNGDSAVEAASVPCTKYHESDNRGFHKISSGGRSFSSEGSKSFEPRSRPSIRQTQEKNHPGIKRSTNQSIRENSLEIDKSKLDDGDNSMWLSSLNMSKVTQDSADSQKPAPQQRTNYGAQVEAEPSIWLAELEQGSIVESSDDDTSVSTSDSGTVESSYSSRSQSDGSYSDEESSGKRSYSSGESRSGSSAYEDSRESIVSQSTGSIVSETRGFDQESVNSRHASWRDDPEQGYFGESSERYQSDNGASFSNTETLASKYAESAHSLASRYASQHEGNFATAVPPSPATPSGRTLATDAYDSFAAETPAKSVRERSVVAEYHRDLQLSSMQNSGLSRLTEVSSNSSRQQSSQHSRDQHPPQSGEDANVDFLLETIPTIASNEIEEDVSVLSLLPEQNPTHVTQTSSEGKKGASQEATTPDSIFVENENLWSNTTKTQLSFETYSSHHRRSGSDLEASSGTFDAFNVESSDFDAVPVSTQENETKELFGSFHKGDFFESAHISKSSRSTSSHPNSRDHGDKSGRSDDSESSRSYGTQSRSSAMTGDSFGSPESQRSASSLLQHGTDDNGPCDPSHPSGEEAVGQANKIEAVGACGFEHPGESVVRESSFSSAPFCDEDPFQATCAVHSPLVKPERLASDLEASDLPAKSSLSDKPAGGKDTFGEVSHYGGQRSDSSGRIVGLETQLMRSGDDFNEDQSMEYEIDEDGQSGSSQLSRSHSTPEDHNFDEDEDCRPSDTKMQDQSGSNSDFSADEGSHSYEEEGSDSDEFWEDSSKYNSDNHSILDEDYDEDNDIEPRHLALRHSEREEDGSESLIEESASSDSNKGEDPFEHSQLSSSIPSKNEFADSGFDDFDGFNPNSENSISRKPSIVPRQKTSRHQDQEGIENFRDVSISNEEVSMANEKGVQEGVDKDFSSGFETHNFPSSNFNTNSSVMSNAEESLNVSQLGAEDNSRSADDEDQEDEPKSLKLSKPKSYGGYNREQIGKLSQRYIALNEAEDTEQGPKSHRKSERNRRTLGKSEALLSLTSNVHDSLVSMEQLQREQAEADLHGSKGKDDDGDQEEEFLTPTRLVFAFEVLVSILLELSDELELLQTFSSVKDSSAIDSLTMLLSQVDDIDERFATLKPILHHFQTGEMIDEELDDFLYGMNLLVDLMCELCNQVATKHQWNAKANTAFTTMLELLARDTLEVRCIYEDVDTPEYHLTYKIQDAWEATGHVEETKTLLITSDLFMFRQICYEVMLSTDQWCPNNNTLMDICGVDDESQEPIEAKEDDALSPPPEPALQILEKIHGEPLPRTPIMASVLRRILPAQAISDPLVSENFARIRNTVRNPLGLPPSSLVTITSVPESIDDPDALGVAGIGKSTVAAMVANHVDVRRFFNDGIAWIYVGETELTYNRYIQCLQDLLAQLEVDEEEEPLFPELLHCPGESFAVRRRREEGFMIYLRETMVEFLRNRNVLIVLDDVCFEPDLDWFDFAPAPSPDQPDDEDDGCCAMLVTSRRRTLLPPADTVEVDMMEQSEARTLLIRESGDLANVIPEEAREVSDVVLECACHPLTIKSVGRWLNLKHATVVEGDDDAERIRFEVFESMKKILECGFKDDHDMLYSTLQMSLSPTINGQPTTIIKFCFAAFVRVFCERMHISDFALADSTPIVPLETTEILFESLLCLEEDTLRNEGSLFYTKKDEASVLIPEALSALGVFKVIITSAEDLEDEESEEEEEEKYIQIMHRIQQEYGEYLYDDDVTLTDLMKDGERRWNESFSRSVLAKNIEWDAEAPDASVDYALEMLPSHLIRGGLLAEAATLLCDESFAKGRLFALGRENGTRRQIKDCETLFELMVEQRAKGKKRSDIRGTIRSAYQTLGDLLKMDEEEFIEEEGSPEAVEVGRCHFELGFSLAEKRCWDGAIFHWESSQEFLVSSLGMVELVAGIQFNVGVVYSELHEYDQALSSLKQCLRIRGAIHGEEHILYAQTIQKIGDVFLAMSDYHEAMESYNWALDVMHIEPSHHRISIGDILEQMGNIHYSKGEIKASLQSYQDGLRSKQVDLGEDHPELASLFHHIGNCLSNLGKTDEAVAHLEEAIRLKKLDPNGGFERDSDVLTIQGILDNLNGMQQEGLRCYELALQILITKVAHRKEKVASLLHLIGCVYLMSGENKKSMKLFEESLHARRKVLGFVHLDVASTLFNMAFLHQTRNRLDKALKCLEEALKIRELRLPNSEKVAVTHEKIGNLARGIGKTKKAENAFEEALVIRKRIHGNNHEAVATVLQELGDLMDDLGNYEDAMRHYVEALEIRENRLGPDDLAVAETYYSMGFTLQNNGALDRALQCLEESLSIRKFQLGDDAKEVGDTLNMMGFLQAKRGELDDALSLLWDALRIRKIQEDHIKVSETLNNIGNVHREKQEFDLSLECYEECARIRRSELGDSHEKVADALIAIGNVQADMDYPDDAMDSYKEALAIRNMLFGEQDESVATVLQHMGTLEFRANELDRAYQLLDEFIRIRQENGTEPDGDYVNVLFMIGNIHKMQENEEEAKKCWTEAYGVFKKLGLAETNPQIAQVMSNLVKDEDVGGSIDDDRKQRGVLDRLGDKVKRAARSANEAGNAVKKATGIKGQDRGSQLL